MLSYPNPTQTEIPRQFNASVLPPPISPLRMQREQGAVLFWLGYRDSDSRGTKPLGRRGSDSLVKGCHSLPLRSNPNFMRENKNNTQQGAVLFCIAPPKKISLSNP